MSDNPPNTYVDTGWTGDPATLNQALATFGASAIGPARSITTNS